MLFDIRKPSSSNIFKCNLKTHCLGILQIEIHYFYRLFIKYI